jgi:uncharacterized protein
MAKTLHPKIQALRNEVGYLPIHEFMPNRKKYEEKDVKYRAPQSSDNDSERLIKQYFCIWGVPDDYGTQPMKGCFVKSLNERGPDSKATNKIVVLNQHNQRSPLCIPMVLKEDEIGLYGEYEPDPEIEENDILVKRVKRGTINGGSYGFNYVWDKMEYDEKSDSILMFECELFEVSPVTLASQGGTFVVRNKNGTYEDKFLEEETEDLIKQIPRKYHLEIRSLITRHISLAKMQPLQNKRKALKNGKPKQRGAIDYNFLTENLSK